MSSGEIVPVPAMAVQTTVDNFSRGLQIYLNQLGLPAEGVLVEVQHRGRVIDNLPAIVGGLSAEQRQAALYLSKMVAACGAGLFDAALNFLWDELISKLRVKVLQFDLEYFFDTAIKDPEERKKYSTEEDLRELDDWTLIKGCHDCGVISEVGYRHLDYIRTMRNWASAAHPNQAQITGFQLLSWLETCIIEVLAKPIEGAAVEVRRLLRNIRQQTLTAADTLPIAANIATLPQELATALLRSVFGLYTDPRTDATVKNNVLLIAPSVWDRCADQIRYEIGLKYSSFSVNGEVDRRDLARTFLVRVNGLTFQPESMLALEFQQKLDQLERTHNAFDNFYNEPGVARDLRNLIPASGTIPPSSTVQYVGVVVLCRIGNPYGVSRAAVSYYNQMIDRFQELHIRLFAKLVTDPEVSNRLGYQGCAQRFQTIAAELLARVAQPNVQAVLQALVNATAPQLPNLGRDTSFRRLLSAMG